MIETSPNALDLATSLQLEEGIKIGRITTFTIEERNLPFYQKATIESGFEVQIIAESGQYYITEKCPVAKRRLPGQENKTPTITAVKSQFPVGEGYVAISLKRPEGVTNDTAFHIARQKIQPK